MLLIINFSCSGCTSLRGTQFAIASDDDNGERKVASDQLPSVMVNTAESCSEMEEGSIEGESLLSLVRHALGGNEATHVKTAIDKKEEKDKVEPSIELNRLPTVSLFCLYLVLMCAYHALCV